MRSNIVIVAYYAISYGAGTQSGNLVIKSPPAINGSRKWKEGRTLSFFFVAFDD